jgi:vancomycin permeability regulator SanA
MYAIIPFHSCVNLFVCMVESTRAAETATEQLARRSAELTELREQFTKFQAEATIRDKMLTQKER